MDSKTYLKNLDVSPKKLRFFLPEIKKYGLKRSMDHLLYMKGSIAKLWHKSLKSAVSNAVNALKTSDDLLEFKALTVEEGRSLKRYRAGSRGSPANFKRRTSHIRITLTEKKTEVKEKIIDKKIVSEPATSSNQKSDSVKPKTVKKIKEVKVSKKKVDQK